MPGRRMWSPGALVVTAVAMSVDVAVAQVRARPTAIPEFAFVIDPAAAAAGLRPLRAAPLPPAAREVRVWTGFGIGIPHSLCRIHTSRGAVRGALVLWWGHDGEWRPEDNPESMHAYVARVFGCGPIRQRGGVDACEAERIEPRPDWRAVLTRLGSIGLDSIGLRAPQTPATDPNVVVMDGYHMVIEVREGAAYRTAYFGMGALTSGGPAARVLAVLRRVSEAAVRDSIPGGE